MPVLLDGSEARLISLLERRWLPVPPALTNVERVVLGDRPLSNPVDLKFTRDGRFAQGALVARLVRQLRSADEPWDSGPERLHAEFEGGWQFHGTAIPVGMRLRGGKSEKELFAFDWSLSKPNIAVTGWITTLPVRVAQIRNLRVRARGYKSFGHLRLTSPFATYVLVTPRALRGSDGVQLPSDALAALLIMPKSDVASADVANEILALQLIIGQPFEIDTLTGVDAEGTPVAVRRISYHYGLRAVVGRGMPILSTTRLGKGQMAVRLFEKLAALMRSANSTTRAAALRYLESLSGTYDARYVTLRIAVESLARSMDRMHGGGRHTYEIIQGLLPDSDRGCLEAADIDVFDKILLTGNLVGDEPEEVLVARARIDRLRGTLGLLLCHAAGWSGATGDESSFDEAQEPADGFDVDVEPETSAPAGYWPELKTPERSVPSLIVRAKAFARGLEARTAGVLRARVTPIARGTDVAPSNYELVAEIAGRPSTRTLLATLRVKGLARDGVAVADVSEHVVWVTTDSELDARLAEIVTASETVAILGALLAAAKSFDDAE